LSQSTAMATTAALKKKLNTLCAVTRRRMGPSVEAGVGGVEHQPAR